MKNYLLVRYNSYISNSITGVIFCFLLLNFNNANAQINRIDSLIDAGSTFEEAHKYDKALSNYAEALKNSQLLNDKSRLQKCYSGLGTLHYRKGNYVLALDFNTKSLRLAEEINDKSGIAFCYSMMGIIYNDNGDNLNGFKYLKKAIEIAEKINDKKLLANFHSKLGSVYFKTNELERAIDSYKTALKILEEINYSKGVSGNLGSLGAIYLQLGKYELASEYVSKQLKMAEESQNKAEIADALYVYGGILVELKKDKEALEYFKRSLQVSREINSAQGIRYAYDGIVTAYYNMNNFKDAFDNYERFKLISDSIFNLEKNYQINEIKIKFETEKKEIENSMLTQKNQIQSLELKQNKNVIIGLVCLVILVILIGVLLIRQYRSQNEKKAMQLEQRVLRAQMNPHFLFNSLNSIQRLFIEGKTEQANDVIADFSNLLRRILNNSGSSLVSLKEETDTLKLYMDIEKIRCDGCFTYSIEIAESIDLLNTLVPPLLIQPFVENAIWHGILPAKKKGLIKIRILKSQNLKNLICTIHDNGVGINLNNLNNSNSKGIQITKQRIGKEVIFETPEEGGTIVTLNIPINI